MSLDKICWLSRLVANSMCAYSSSLYNLNELLKTWGSSGFIFRWISLKVLPCALVWVSGLKCIKFWKVTGDLKGS